MLILFNVLEFFVHFTTIFVGYFIFWNYMYKQGFRNEKIWDFVVVVTFVSLFVGKVFFIISTNKVATNSLVYFLTPPYLISGVIIASIFVTSLLSSSYNWSIFRVGDYLALTLTYFITAFSFVFIFFGFLANGNVDFINMAFAFLYLFLSYYLFTTIKSQIFSGYVFTVFLLATAFVEVSKTLIYNLSLQFSHLTYFAIIVFAAINYYDRTKEIKKMKGNLPQEFIDKMKARLESQKSEVEAELNELREDDSFIQDESRSSHNAEEASEAQELEDHYDNEANRGILKDTLNQINKALGRLRIGKYGVDENTGEPINKDRLEANPSATTNVSKD